VDDGARQQDLARHAPTQHPNQDQQGAAQQQGLQHEHHAQHGFRTQADNGKDRHQQPLPERLVAVGQVQAVEREPGPRGCIAGNLEVVGRVVGNDRQELQDIRADGPPGQLRDVQEDHQARQASGKNLERQFGRVGGGRHDGRAPRLYGPGVFGSRVGHQVTSASIVPTRQVQGKGQVRHRARLCPDLSARRPTVRGAAARTPGPCRHPGRSRNRRARAGGRSSSSG